MKFERLHDGIADHDQTYALINRGYSANERSAGQWFFTERGHGFCLYAVAGAHSRRMATVPAIARVVAMVWRQEKMAEEARAIGELGAELYASLATMTEHVGRVGRNLGEASGAYNDFIASLESRVLTKARRFPDMGVDKGKKPIPELAPVEKSLRLVQAPELKRLDGGEAAE